MKKEVNITYIKEWALTDGIHRPIHGYAKVGTLFTKHYHSAIFLLAGLNASSRDLLEFLIQRMDGANVCLLYTSPSPRDGLLSRMPSSA